MFATQWFDIKNCAGDKTLMCNLRSFLARSSSQDKLSTRDPKIKIWDFNLAGILRWDIWDPEVTIYYYIATLTKKVPFREPIHLANAKNLEGRGEATHMITFPNLVQSIPPTFILLHNIDVGLSRKIHYPINKHKRKYVPTN